MKSREKKQAISLFSGAGGLDIGLEQAGFWTALATDSDKECVQTLRANGASKIRIAGAQERFYLHDTRIVRGDVSDLSAQDLKPATMASHWRPDLLVGGPPCQPFSPSGKQLSVLDSRGRLFEEFVRLAGELAPRFILFENVRGLVTARGASGQPGEVLHLVRDAFEGIGYATRFALLNAADFGCPQRRVRLFMIATKDHALPDFPLATHAREPKQTLFGVLEPWVSLGEALRSLPPPVPEELVRPSATLAPLLEPLAPGSGLRSPGRKEPTRPGGHWGYKQGTFLADPNLPARTVTAASTQDWVRGSDGSLRRLTLRECAALQGFPAEWEFAGNRTSKFRQVGNAVPSIFGKVIGERILEALDAPQPTGRLESASFPDYMHGAIEYTLRDHERNRVSRTRAKTFTEG